MTLDDFAETTRHVIAKDGFGAFQPTAIFPERNHLAVLAGVPQGVDLDHACRKWVRHLAVGNEEYLFAFKVDGSHFKVVHGGHGIDEEAVFVTNDA